MPARLETLRGMIEARLARRRVVLDLMLDPADGAGVSWLHRHAEVMTKGMRDDGSARHDGAGGRDQCGADPRQVRTGAVVMGLGFHSS